MGYRKGSNTFQFKKDHYSKNAEYIKISFKEVLILMKFLQIKPQVKRMKKNVRFCVKLLLKIEIDKREKSMILL